jgi:hypothetical protein
MNYSFPDRNEWMKYQQAIYEAVALNKNPKRKVVSVDDVSNVAIDLNTTPGVQEFLFRIGWTAIDEYDLLKDIKEKSSKR